MDRRSASQEYRFKRTFCEHLMDQLPQCTHFFHVLSEGRVVSTELVLVSAEHAYSFLGGTLAEAFEVRANDLLKHEIIRWAKQAGKKTLCSEEATAQRTVSFATSGPSLPRANGPFASGRAFSILLHASD